MKRSKLIVYEVERGKIMLKELLEKEFITLEELEIIGEDEDVAEVQDNGMSGEHYNKHWYTVVLEDGEEFDVYV